MGNKTGGLPEISCVSNHGPDPVPRADDHLTPRNRKVIGKKILARWPHETIGDYQCQQLVTACTVRDTIYHTKFARFVDPTRYGDMTDVQVTQFQRYIAGCAGKLPVKLVLVALPLSEEKGIKQNLAMFMARRANASYGLAHIDILVGDQLIGWFDHGLVDIRPVHSGAGLRRAIAVFDLHADISCADAEPWLKKLSQLIVDWNIHNDYNRDISSLEAVRSGHKSNCQGFARDFMATMEIKESYLSHGIVNEFIANFVANPSGWDTSYKLLGQSLPLYSHAAFDEWVITTFRGQKWPADQYDLLKGICRGFWFRYQAQKEFIAIESAKAGGGDAKKLEVANAEMLRCQCVCDQHGTPSCPFGSPLPYEHSIPEVIRFEDVKFGLTPGYQDCLITKCHALAMADVDDNEPATPPPSSSFLTAHGIAGAPISSSSGDANGSDSSAVDFRGSAAVSSGPPGGPR